MKINTNIPGPLVNYLRRKWRLNFFVETGTCHGDTTELAAIMFDHVWSCDIDEALINAARLRLKDYSGVRLSVEHSPDFLRRIKPEVELPAMYWLDAHWCGGPVKPIRECPLLDELKAITSLRGEHGFSVILIDDIELIEAPPPPPHDRMQWPTMDEVRLVLNSWNEPYEFTWYQGTSSRVLAITPGENGIFTPPIVY